MQENDTEPAISPEPDQDVVQRRPSLAERLMMPPHAPTSVPDRTSSTATPPVQPAQSAETTPERDTLRPEPERRAPLNLNSQAQVASLKPQVQLIEDSLRQAARFSRVRFYVYLASVAVMFVLTLIAAIAVGVSLPGSIEWERVGAAGALGGISLVALYFLQYRIAAAFGEDSFHLAELNAALDYLKKSSEFWEQFLADREAAGALTNNDVATAVKSLTEATQGLMAIDAERFTASRGRNRRGKNQPPAARIPTPVTPDPRRY